MAACGLMTDRGQLSSAPRLSADEDKALTHARELLKKAILVDGHNDLPWAIRTDKKAPSDVAAYDLNGTVSGQTDLKRLRQGGVGAQFWSVYIPGEIGTGYARMQLEQIDIARRMIARIRSLKFATTVATFAPLIERAASLRCSAWKAVMRSRIRWAPCAPITTSACAT